MAIADSFRNMPDFVAKDKPSLSFDKISVRHAINVLLKDKLVQSNADLLHPGLNAILSGTTSET
jgi:hypothetical protein